MDYEYKMMMVNDYRDLKKKHNDLRNMLAASEAGVLKFEPACPINILREQEIAMDRLLYTMEKRAAVEKIDLSDVYEAPTCDPRCSM